MNKRENLVLTNEEGQFALTIMYPMSAEHNGKLFVVYEDSLGDVEFKIMKPIAISNNYNVDINQIKSFYKEMENKNKDKNIE